MVTARNFELQTRLKLQVKPLNLIFRPDPTKPKSTRKSDQKNPNMTKSTLHDPAFHVDSKSALKITVTTRNPELQSPIEPAGQALQLDIPTRPNRTEPIFELAIEF